MKRHLQGSDSSGYSNSDCFEFRHTPLARKHEDDDISCSERKVKKLKTTTTTLLESSASSGDSKIDWTKTEELLILKEDVPCVEQVRMSNAIDDDGEKDKCEDLNVLQEALEVAASFLSLGKYQQKSLLRNLKNLGATQRKELTDEWKALLAEEMQLGIKKQSFYAKLVKAGFSA